jgi:hypothetical protein
MKTFSKAFVFALLATAACNVDSEPGSVVVDEEQVAEAKQELTPMPINNGARRTVVIVDDFVLENFTMERVFNQLVALSGTTGRTPVDLYKQWWDTLATTAAGNFPADPHCDDPGVNNSFPQNEPHCNFVQERDRRNGSPRDWKAIGLFNRFDLAPKDGKHCGEYRIVFTPKDGGTNFAIFEGILPNPTPECGIESCRPVVALWESLAGFNAATKSGQVAINEALERLYFTGLKGGFEPVVHPDHYGAVSSGTYASSGGQIRVNMFETRPWQLREFNLVNTCNGKGKIAGPIGTCRLQMRPVTVKNNPFFDLFDVGTAETRGPAFQAAFLDSVASLAVDDVNRIGMNIDDQFNTWQSNSQSFNEQYETNLGPPNAFTASISSKLSLIGSLLNPTQLVTRATTQSCAGCHELSNGDPLGRSDGATTTFDWPPSNGFTHIDANKTLSPALINEFLPFRKELLDGFHTSPPVSCDIIRALPKNPADAHVTVAGKPATAAN